MPDAFGLKQEIDAVIQKEHKKGLTVITGLSGLNVYANNKSYTAHVNCTLAEKPVKAQIPIGMMTNAVLLPRAGGFERIVEDLNRQVIQTVLGGQKCN